MNPNESSICNASTDFIVVQDFIQRLNYQKSILNPQIMKEAMKKVKRNLTSEQIIELINGVPSTQQFIAEKSIIAIRKVLNEKATAHLACNSPNIQLEHNNTYENNNDHGFENNIVNLNNSDSHTSDSHNSVIQSPINSQSVTKSQQNNNIHDIEMDHNDTDIEILNNNHNNNHNINDNDIQMQDSESIVSDDSLTLSLDLELSQRTTISECTNSNQITAMQIFGNNILSTLILAMLDDISICFFAEINTKCNNNSQTVNKYIQINTNHWLVKYILNGNHSIKHMIECKEIILDFSNDNEIYDLHNQFIIDTFYKMREKQIFQKCNKLSIISPSTAIAKILGEIIGDLNCIKELFFRNIEIFPMIKIVTNIPSELSLLKRLSMINIFIKLDKDNIEYTDNDIWMTKKINTNVMHTFIERLVECKYIIISEWKNKYDFWNEWLSFLHNTFECSKLNKLSLQLQDSLKHSPIKEFVYIPGHPNQDRIPHTLLRFMFKFKGCQIQKLRLHFAGSSNLYHAIINKAIKQKLEMNVLKELYFGWSDKISYQLLNSFVKGNKLKKVRLFIPEKRNLCKQEEKIIAAFKRKCNNVTVRKGVMSLVVND